MDRELSEEELQELYAWIDKIPLSRPKRHITRDFSDGGSSLSFRPCSDLPGRRSLHRLQDTVVYIFIKICHVTAVSGFNHFVCLFTCEVTYLPLC